MQHYNDYYSETQQSLEFCFLRKLLCSYLELAFKVGWENQKKPKIEAGKLDRMGAWPRVLRKLFLVNTEITMRGRAYLR